MYTVPKMCTGTLSQNISTLSQKYTRCPRINLTLSAENIFSTLFCFLPNSSANLAENMSSKAYTV